MNEFYADNEYEERIRDLQLALDGAMKNLATVEAERHILAALREPSDTVIQAVDDTIYNEFGVRLSSGRARRILYSAIAAAEKEVTNE